MMNQLDRHQPMWLASQGYLGYTSDQYGQFGNATRFAPAICLSLVAIGTATQTSVLLFGLVPFALIGGIASRHPFDLLYNFLFARNESVRAIPKHGPQRKFACRLATLNIVAAAVAFELGNAVLGAVLGYTLVLLAAVPAMIGFCVPSYIYNSVQRMRSQFKPTNGYNAPAVHGH